MHRVCGALLLSAGAAACQADDPDNSCGIPTSELSLVATAVDNGPTLRAEVDFTTVRASGELSIALCDEDKLIIAGEEPQRVDRPDRVIYSYTSEVTSSPTVEFEFVRDGEDSVTFSITMPPAFEVTAPQPDTEISRSAELLLEWLPPNPGGSMRIALAEEIGNGVCLETLVEAHNYKDLSGVDIEDDGNWKIPAATIDSGARDKCDATYRFARLASAEYPAALHAGGYLEGRVERAVAFSSVP